MRRFITSLPGKVFSQLVILALLLPSFSLIAVSKAIAQVSVQPTLAVVEFQNDKAAGTSFGKLVADQLTSEFTKLNTYDVESAELVDKTVQTLGISSPPESKVNLFRIARDLHATYIVSGEISDYRIVPDEGRNTRHAVVSLSVVVYDVASETALNGASVAPESTSRAKSVDDATLINDAISTGAELAVQKIHNSALPYP